jgi:hypothetical protein
MNYSILLSLLYNSEIHKQLNEHYNASKGVYAAFQRLVKENEAPAIIIADLLRSFEDKEEKYE